MSIVESSLRPVWCSLFSRRSSLEALLVYFNLLWCQLLVKVSLKRRRKDLKSKSKKRKNKMKVIQRKSLRMLRVMMRAAQTTVPTSTCFIQTKRKRRRRANQRDTTLDAPSICIGLMSSLWSRCSFIIMSATCRRRAKSSLTCLWIKAPKSSRNTRTIRSITKYWESKVWRWPVSRSRVTRDPIKHQQLAMAISWTSSIKLERRV